MKGLKIYKAAARQSRNRLSFIMQKWVRVMRIGEYIKKNDINTYRKLVANFGFSPERKKRIELGDRVENLMKHDSYKRIGRRVRQVKWG